MSNEPLKIDVEKQSMAARGRRRAFPWMPVAVLAIVVVAGIWFALLRPVAEIAAPINDSPTKQEAGDDAPEATPEPIVATETLVDDDGQTLWVSPTAGDPISLSHLPSGTQLLLYLRPADLLAHAEGEKVVAALGPFGQSAIEHIQRLLGKSLREISTLTIAISPRADGGFDYSLRAELLERDDKLVGAPLISGDPERARFAPPSAAGQMLVSCPVEFLEELMSAEDEPIRFARDMQRLLDRTDAQRMATLILPNKFLETGGLKLLSGRGEPLRAVFRDLVGDAATAVAFSAHWDDNFFFELQSAVALNQRPHRFAAALGERVRKAPDAAENVLLAEPLDPHGQKVATRLPAMMRELSRYTRSGEQQGVSISRCYLPAPAGHNLLMAAELLLSRPGQ